MKNILKPSESQIESFLNDPLNFEENNKTLVAMREFYLMNLYESILDKEGEGFFKERSLFKKIDEDNLYRESSQILGRLGWEKPHRREKHEFVKMIREKAIAKCLEPFEHSEKLHKFFLKIDNLEFDLNSRREAMEGAIVLDLLKESLSKEAFADFYNEMVRTRYDEERSVLFILDSFCQMLSNKNNKCKDLYSEISLEEWKNTAFPNAIKIIFEAFTSRERNPIKKMAYKGSYYGLLEYDLYIRNWNEKILMNANEIVTATDFVQKVVRLHRYTKTHFWNYFKEVSNPKIL